MTNRVRLAALVLAGFGLAVAACSEDSTGTENQTDEIVGTWVSKGSDVAPGLAASPFLTDSIIATFNANGSYTVLNYYGGTAQPATLTGTYTVGSQPEGSIRSIEVVQTSPQAVTSQGIFQVTGSTMKYEIIQVEPALAGVNPPTVAGGFGSTTVGGTATGTYWVQNYDLRN